MPSENRFRGKCAVVTGSTSGIGLAIVRGLAEAGADVVLNGFGNERDIEELRADVEQQFGVTALYVSADVSRPAEVENLVRTAETELGAVDILVNNAGIQFVAPIEEFPIERWQEILTVDLSAAFFAIRAALPGMRQRGFGRIINTSSAHGLVASPHKSAYVAAKHGLVGLTKVVALETALENITCNAVCPGFTQTPIVDGQIDELAQSSGLTRERVIDEIVLGSQPSRRFVVAEEIAQLVVFLSGDTASSITGAALPIDGGWTAR